MGSGGGLQAAAAHGHMASGKAGPSARPRVKCRFIVLFVHTYVLSVHHGTSSTPLLKSRRMKKGLSILKSVFCTSETCGLITLLFL